MEEFLREGVLLNPSGIRFGPFRQEWELRQDLRNLCSRKSQECNLRRAPDEPVIFLQALRCRPVEARAFQAFRRPKQLADRVVKSVQTAVHRGIIVEETQTVVVQQRRRGPDGNKGRRPIKSYSATARGRTFRRLMLGSKTFFFSLERIEIPDLADEGQLLIAVGAEVLPHVSEPWLVHHSAQCIGSHRARRVGAHERHRHTVIRGKIIILPELGRLHRLFGPLLILWVLHPTAWIVVP